MRILLVDDDPEFREFASFAFDAENIDYSLAEDVEQGLAALQDAEQGPFDLLLLDVEMPGRHGWELLMEIREAGNEIPVLFVTGRHAVEERVRGLRMGADDYILKPIEFEELIARIEAVLRRRRSMAPIVFGDLQLDPVSRKLRRAGHPVELTPLEYDLLLALLQAEGEVVGRKQLLRDVWQMDFDPETNVLDVQIGRLRRKLDRHGRPMIETVRGRGYRLLRHDA